MKTNYWLLGIVVMLPFFGFSQRKNAAKAQPTPLRKLSADIYDAWKVPGFRAVSTDGNWAAFTENPQEGDGKVVFRNLKNNFVDSVHRATDIRISHEADYAVFKIKPPFKETQDAKRKKTKKEDMPRDLLGLYHFSDKKISKIPNVLNYKIPEKSGAFLAYQFEKIEKKPKTKKDTTAKTAVVKDSTQKIVVKPKKAPKKESEENGYRVMLRNIKTQTEQLLSYVTEYEFSKNGQRFAYITMGNDSTQKIPSVWLMDLANGTSSKLFEAKGKYKKLSFDEDGNQLAFIADLDTNAKTLVRSPKLFYWKQGVTKAEIIAEESTQPGNKGWLVSGDAPLTFAKDGSKLFFGTNPRPAVADTTLLPEEIVNVEVWGPKDDRLYPQQKAQLEQEKKRAYSAVFHTENRKLVQLGSPEIPIVQQVNEGRSGFVLGLTDVPYSNQHWDWNPRFDVYTIDTQDGSKKRIATTVTGNVSASPEGKYLYWFALADTAWFAAETATGKIIRLTNARRFADEDDDHPDFPRQYGAAGWSKNDEYFLLYDKFDVWQVNPQSPEKNIRLTQGREAKREFRNINLDPEARSIDLTKPLLFRFFQHDTKKSGFVQYADKQTTERFSVDGSVGGGVVKAKNTDDLIFSWGNFTTSPEWYATTLGFKNTTQISAFGEQAKVFAWGSVELVAWKAADGTPLQGLLYKPADFDATRKYPMLTYFYEKMSDDLHQFYNPSPGGSAFTNFSYATSNGYAVFVPDIVYKNGYPGQSAYNCVMPGVLAMLDKGFVDASRLGIVGHSWGGYQAAYLITQTTLFKVAVPGAPVANMTSAYGGIRWGTGMSRQAQYEHTQSRIGGTLWEKTQQYLDNSPLFHLPRVTTPTLILHNDDDDAVPWYQGIELYMGLKRLGKPTWLLNYNGEKHGNRLRKNQKDWTLRMWQFLDVYLKDAPAPRWMTDGLPATEKGYQSAFGGKVDKVLRYK